RPHHFHPGLFRKLRAWKKVSRAIRTTLTTLSTVRVLPGRFSAEGFFNDGACGLFPVYCSPKK
ncbi:MAG: hypothetical protein IJ751_06810, partial [Oscillospiraceae bacterium]|nr:hypothetical protein [Oscillospiraceae bacterium]